MTLWSLQTAVTDFELIWPIITATNQIINVIITSICRVYIRLCRYNPGSESDLFLTSSSGFVIPYHFQFESFAVSLTGIVFSLFSLFNKTYLVLKGFKDRTKATVII